MILLELYFESHFSGPRRVFETGGEIAVKLARRKFEYFAPGPLETLPAGSINLPHRRPLGSSDQKLGPERLESGPAERNGDRRRARAGQIMSWPTGSGLGERVGGGGGLMEPD